MVRQIALSSCEITGTDISAYRKVPDSEYANNAVLLGEKPNELQVFLDCLNNDAGIWDAFCTLEVQNVVAGLRSGMVCVQKGRLIFTDLRHLWRPRDIRLTTEDRVYTAS